MASTEQSSKLYYTSKYGSIKKLDDTNYTVERRRDCYPGSNERIRYRQRSRRRTTGRTAIADYRKRRALATSAIRFPCTEEVVIYINGLSNPRETWQTLNEGLDSTTSYIGRAAIITKFQNALPITGESIGVYVVRLQSYRLQLQGSMEGISEQALRPHVYTTAPPEFKTAIAILKRTAGITIATLTTALKATEEENKAEAAVIDPKSGTGLCGRGRGGRGGRGGHGGTGENQDKSCTYCNMDNRRLLEASKIAKLAISQACP